MNIFRSIYLKFFFLFVFFPGFLFSVNLRDKGKRIIKEADATVLSQDFLRLSVAENSDGYTSDVEDYSEGDDGSFSDDEEEIIDGIQKISISSEQLSDDFYQSDSEDEDYSVDKDYDDLKIQEPFSEDTKKEVVAFYRGAHFVPKYFNKEQISKIRRTSEVGRSIHSAHVFDKAFICFGVVISDDQEKKLADIARDVKESIARLSEDERNKLQQLYTNNYDKFHLQLTKPGVVFRNVFEKLNCLNNMLISCSESCRHAGKYAYGEKVLGKDSERLDPGYDENGKARHPYLGKIYIILIGVSEVDKLDPYFVISKYANNIIDINARILYEREVSIGAIIPGKYIVYDKVVRVPSQVTGTYKKYYEVKYGISERRFNLMKKKIEAIHNILKKLPSLEKDDLDIALQQLGDKESIVKNFFDVEDKDKKNKLLEIEEVEALKKILKKRMEDIIERLIESIREYISDSLVRHVKNCCDSKGITINYKDLDDGFCDKLPDIKIDVKEKRKKIQGILVDGIHDKYQEERSLDNDNFISGLKEVILSKREYNNYANNVFLSKKSIPLHLYLFNDLNKDLKIICKQLSLKDKTKQKKIKEELQSIKKKIKESEEFEDEKKHVKKNILSGDPLRSVGR